MTAKEELQQLILSLNAEQIETAIKVFQEHFEAKQAESQPQTQTC